MKCLENIVLTHYNNPKTKPNIDFLLGLKNQYEYVPKHDKTKVCLYCNQHHVIKSHSVSRNQLDTFSNNNKEQLYAINNKNTFLILLFILKIIIQDKKINNNEYPFEPISINDASTFPGFCGSKQGKKLPNHDYNLFHNIDGRKGLNNKNDLMWEILYRTLSWKLFKFQSELTITSLFQAYSSINPYFLNLWSEILTCGENVFSQPFINNNNLPLLILSNDEVALKYNISYIKKTLNFLVSIKNTNLYDYYDFKIDKIDKPNFIGINYFLNYYGENHKFIQEINSDLCVGILCIDNQYYSFLINRKNSTLNYLPMKIIKELLLLEDPSNTFIIHSDKQKIQQYLDKN